jgi:undecaprenyl-diphosphatase
MSVCALAVFLGWTVYVQPGVTPSPVDLNIAYWMKASTDDHPALRGLFVGLTFLGSPPALALLAGIGVAGSVVAGRKALAVGWLVAAAGGGLLDYAAKKVIDRPRPPEELRDAAVHEQNESYPSGHAMGSVIGFGMVAYAATRGVRRRRLRTAICVACSILIAGIGTSRIVLRAHWFSDVIAGFAIGTAWLFFWILWIEVLRRRAALAERAGA